METLRDIIRDMYRLDNYLDYWRGGIFVGIILFLLWALYKKIDPTRQLSWTTILLTISITLSLTWFVLSNLYEP